MPVIDSLYDSDSDLENKSDNENQNTIKPSTPIPEVSPEQTPDVLYDYEQPELDLIPSQTMPRLLDPGFHAVPREIPHTLGAQPAHMYFEYYPSPPIRQHLDSTARSRGFSPLSESTAGAPLPLHVSLTETLIVQAHELDRFTAAVTRWAQGLAAPGPAPGPQRLSGILQLLHSPTGKVFLAAQVVPEPNGTHIGSIITALNAILRSLDIAMPELSPDFPHVSIGWSLDRSSEDQNNKNKNKRQNDVGTASFDMHMTPVQGLVFRHIGLKVGQKITKILI